MPSDVLGFHRPTPTRLSLVLPGGDLPSQLPDRDAGIHDDLHQQRRGDFVSPAPASQLEQFLEIDLPTVQASPARRSELEGLGLQFNDRRHVCSVDNEFQVAGSVVVALQSNTPFPKHDNVVSIAGVP